MGGGVGRKLASHENMHGCRRRLAGAKQHFNTRVVSSAFRLVSHRVVTGKQVDSGEGRERQKTKKSVDYDNITRYSFSRHYVHVFTRTHFLLNFRRSSYIPLFVLIAK